MRTFLQVIVLVMWAALGWAVVLVAIYLISKS